VSLSGRVTWAAGIAIRADRIDQLFHRQRIEQA